MVKGYDEVENALRGIPKVQNSEDGSGSSFDGALDEYMVLQPNFWASADASSDLGFDSDLFISDEAININGEFSYDLDLFYTAEDIVKLFDYFYKDYEAICELGLELFRTNEDDQERIMELNELLMSFEYNYLSEDQHVRDILFNVCLLNEEMSAEDKKLFHSANETWNNMFS